MVEIPRWKWEEPEPFEEHDYWADILRFLELMEAGKDKQYTWTQLAYQDPPERLPDRIMWTIGVGLQMILSVLTFPAAIGAFLLEESVQSAGMGAYILSSSRYYDLLDVYLPTYKTFLDAAEVGARSLAYLNPVAGGAVLCYMGAAQMSHDAFRAVTDRKLIEQMEKDAELRQKLLDEQKYGELRLSSSPSQAEIWIDGINTELLTPQTFKNMEAGEYIFELRKFNTKTETFDIYAYTLTIEAGRRKEIHVRPPPGISDEIEEPDVTDETEEGRLPIWIKAEVEGDYAVDGDTFRTTTGERIRILGIDAPELGRPWADVAGAYLDDLVHGKNISLKIQSSKPLDTYGRTLAICKMYKGDIAELMLSAGLARLMVFEDDIYDPTSYELAEAMAKERRIGIWGEMP